MLLLTITTTNFIFVPLTYFCRLVILVGSPLRFGVSWPFEVPVSGDPFGS